MAAFGAVIGLHLIAIVAGLPQGANTIAATRRGAVVGARVFGQEIAVIAGFVALLPFGDVPPHDAIAATGGKAVTAAGILVVSIAIIAGFAFIDSPIAAGFRAAFAIAAIARVIIAIVATLKPDSSDAITATGAATIIGTVVGIGLVAIVADLTGIEPPIAADLLLAFIIAAIAGDVATVIAGLKASLLGRQISAQNTVTATG